MLTKILTSDLHIYRRLYQFKWPKFLVTCGLFDHFIDRFQKFPEWEDKVQFLKVENSFINDATFVFISGQHVYFDTLEDAPFKTLHKLMHQMDYSQEKVFIGVRDIFRPFIDDLTRVHHLEKTFDIGTRCLNMFINLKPDMIKFIEEDVQSRMPKGFYSDSLTEKDAVVMDSVWAQRHIGSVDFLKMAIKMNPSTGIFKDDGELIAWSIFLETGAMGNLQVKKEYQRQDFATLVSQLQYVKIIKMGRVPFGHIVHQNDASFNFSTKRHNATWIGNNSWIGVKKKPKSELLPLWGHL